MALLPRQRLSKPSFWYVWTIKLIAALAEKCCCDIWKFIFVLSRGAIVVLAAPPAIAPAARLVHTRWEFVMLTSFDEDGGTSDADDWLS